MDRVAQGRTGELNKASGVRLAKELNGTSEDSGDLDDLLSRSEEVWELNGTS